jgi:hypothetical protein
VKFIQFSARPRIGLGKTAIENVHKLVGNLLHGVAQKGGYDTFATEEGRVEQGRTSGFVYNSGRALSILLFQTVMVR